MDKVNGIRYVVCDNKKVYDYLKQKDGLVADHIVLEEKSIDIGKKADKIKAKIQKIKDKAKPIMQKEADAVELGEWEVITTFQIEADEVTVQILDQVEAEKDRIRDSKLKQDIKK